MSFNNQLPYALLPPPPPPPPPEDDFPTAPAYAAASFVKESPVEPHYLSVPPPGFVPSVPELSYPSISAYYPQPWPSQWQGTAPGGYAEQPTDPYYTQSYAYGSYYSSYADEIQRYEEWKKKFDEVQPKQNAYPDYKTEFRERYLILHPRIDHRSSRSREPYHDKLRSHDRRRRSRTRSRDRIRKRSRSRSGDRRSRVVSSRDRPSRDRPSRDRRSRDRRSRDRRSNDRRSRDPRDRRSPDRRSPDRRSPDRRSPDRRSPDCRSPDRRSPDRRSPDCRSPDRRSPDRRSPDRRSPDCRSPDRRSPDCRSPDRRSRDRHSKARRPRSPRYSRSSSMRSERLSRETVDRSETPAREGVSEHGSSTVGSIVKEESGRDSLFSSRMRGLSLSDRSKSVDKNRGSSKAKSRTSDKDIILEKFRTSEEIVKKIEEIANEDYLEDDDDITWCRSSPAELYYKSNPTTPSLIEAKARNIKLSETFFEELIERGRKARPEADELPPSRVYKAKLCKHKLEKQSDSSDSSSDSIESDDSKDEADRAMDELQRKQKHPRRLHPEMWYNTAGEMNDGPACRCSAKTKRTGIRHSVYAGEEIPPLCDPNSNNFNKLHHYRILISPPTNFLIKNPTIITHDDHEFLFSGFSVFSHYPIGDLPDCKVIRFNIEYTISYVEEKTPLNFTVKELDLFQEYLFIEILELVDLNLGEKTADGCSQFHFMPRFVRNLPEGGCEVLSMCEVLKYLLKQSGPLVKENDLPKIHKMDQIAWQKIVDDIKGMIVTYPGKKPCSVRVDQLDRNPPKEIDKSKAKLKYYPEIVHFGIRPPEISYAGNPQYQKALRYYVKYRHLVANMAKPTWEERRRLQEKGAHLQDMRTHSRMKRDVTVAVSSQGFHLTGLMCDIVQHAMLLPVLVCHLRFHNSLNSLEDILQYKFLNRRHLQLALTHPSYRENFGTNPDHARNSLTNCGIRQPKYGDRRIHYMNTRKRGINTLINIMSRFGKKRETESAIGHNERLEFLGDAVVEFLTSIHLFRMFPDLEEGGLATFRAAIVQNQHLALLAKKIGLEKYMLYAHGSDLCHDLDLRHAMANCFEALIGAMFLDGGIDVADNVFALALWMDNLELLDVWTRERNHPLQEQEPLGDRKYIKDFDFLQRLAQFESTIGIYFKHIRLLARAFTDRSLGFTNLTLGSNQRLEFLGDTVLQLVVSDKLYRHFPEHHEGHLSLLRSSLVNNRTQSVVCDDLDMAKYAVYHNPKTLPSTKGKADLLEAFLGALYIDKNIEYCTVFCNAVLFPRLQEFILNQDWNDPKSKLQQCCLTLRTMEGGEPDIPIYKVIECLGPTNTRVYTVAVYFRGNRLATAAGHSIQEAEMNAAKNALDNGKELFPQLDHQKRVIAERIKSHRRSRNQKARKNGKDLNRAAGSKDCDGQNKKTKAPNYDLLNENLPKAYMHGKTWEDEGDDSSDAESVKSYESTKWQARSRSTSFTSTSTESGSEDKNEDTDLDCTSDDSLSSSPVQGKTATVAIDILEEFKGRSLKLRSEDEVEKENVEAKIDESVINVEERAKVKAKKFKEEKIQKKDKEKVDKKVEEQVEDNVEEKVKEKVEKKVKGKIDESVMNVEERAIVKAKKFKEEKIQKKDKEKVDKKVEEQVEDNVEEKVKEKVEKKVKGKIDESVMNVEERAIVKAKKFKEEKIQKKDKEKVDKKVEEQVEDNVEEKVKEKVEKKVKGKIDESVMNVEERAKVKAKKFKEEKIQKKDKEKVDKKVEEQVEDNVEEKVKEKVEKKVKGKIEEKLKGKIEEKVKGKAEKEVRVKDEDKFVKKVRNKIEEKAEKKAEEKIKEMVKDKSKGKTERKVKEKDVEKVRNKIEEKAEKRAEEKIKEMVKDKSKGKTERKVKEKVVEKVRNEIEKKAEEKIKEMVKDKSNGKTERKVKEKIERKFKEEIVKKVKDNIKEKMKDKEKNEEKFEMEKKVSNVVKVLPSNYYDFVASYKKPNPDLEEGEIESD